MIAPWANARSIYDRRASEYDATITLGLDAKTIAAYKGEVSALGSVLEALPGGRILEVACGTGLFTHYLRGQVVALDRSARMLSLARASVPAAWLVQATVPALPFAAQAFDRLITCHFYGHLVEAERVAFLVEAHRVASELVVVDTAASTATPSDGWQERSLRDGTRHTIYKRHFTPSRLLAELGRKGHRDGTVLFAGRFFVAVRLWV